MKVNFNKITAIALLFFVCKTTAQSQTRRVLFLGNSYTYVNNVPLLVSELATNTGDVLIYDSNLIGGYTLQNHYASTISQNKIVADDWDYIVLQEQSQQSAYSNPTNFMDGFYNLKNYIKQYKPCSQITSFMTWGHQNGDATNCPTNPLVCTYDGMQNSLLNNYMSISNVNEAEVTPVGMVWKYIKENHPSINLYQSDGSHPSLAGSYLIACCFYTAIFRKNPMAITNNYGLDAATAMLIRNATKSILYDHMTDWYIGTYVPSSTFYYAIGNGANEVQLYGNTMLNKDSYSWDFGDGTTSTGLNPSHSYLTNGNYTIKLTSYKCYLGQNITSVYEKTVNFCSHTNTIYPNLILCPNTTGTIWTQPADSYQWHDYLGNPIAGETAQSMVVTSGEYSVETSINGCIEMSPRIFVDEWIDNPNCILSVVDINKQKELLVFPNPVQHTLSIQTQKEIKEVLIYNLLGEKINVTQISSNTIDLSILENGHYLIKIILDDDITVIKRIVKK